MPKAMWNGTVIAESDATVIVDGNHYFPPDSIHSQYLADSDKRTVCPWKGEARYKSIAVEGQLNPDAAWYYPECTDAAKNIEGYFAFWNGVIVEP